MPISQAYVLPYRRQPSGQFEVLVGFKQVVSFEAVAQHLHKPDLKVWQSINFASPLQGDGKVNCEVGAIGKRFGGALLPAGGKPAFFGGRVERGERPETAVVREFLEEVGLQNEVKIGSKAIGKPFYTADWGGAYFALNVDEHVSNFNWEAHLAKTNLRIKNYEEKADLELIANAGFVRGEWYPEMRKLAWIKANALVKEMNEWDADLIRREVKKFARFLLERVQVKAGEESFADAVENHMLNQPIESNVDAAKAFKPVW